MSSIAEPKKAASMLSRRLKISGLVLSSRDSTREYAYCSLQILFRKTDVNQRDKSTMETRVSFLWHSFPGTNG